MDDQDAHGSSDEMLNLQAVAYDRPPSMLYKWH
jgi:hypothetical protein